MRDPSGETGEEGKPEGDEEEGDERIRRLEIDEVGTEEGLEEVVAEVMSDGFQMPGEMGVEVVPAYHRHEGGDGGWGKVCVPLCVYEGGW